METNSILNDIQIAKPCPVSWDGMSGDERVRFCGDCKKHVYNIAEMTRKEAEHLIQASEGKACLRLFRRADGTVITDDCPRAFRQARDTAVRVLSLCASAALFLFTVVGAQAKDGKTALPVKKQKCESTKTKANKNQHGAQKLPGFVVGDTTMGKVEALQPTMGAPVAPSTEPSEVPQVPAADPPKELPAKSSK
jgi:hypothetical protein